MLIKKITLYDDRVSLAVPGTFEFLSEEQIASLYAIGDRPNVVLMDKEDGAILSAIRTKDNLSFDEVVNKTTEVAALFQKIVPNCRCCQLANKTDEAGNVWGMVYYVSTAPIKEMFNLILVSALDGKEFLLAMHCETSKIIKYGEVFQHIMDSIRIEKE